MTEKNQIIFGYHAIIEAFKAGKTLDKILLSQKAARNELLDKILVLAKAHEVWIQRVPEVKIEKEARGQNHQGIVAYLSEIRYANLESLITQTFEQGKNPLIVILDGVTDVHNFGAIARATYCAGADGLVIPTQNSAKINSVAIKTSAGALMHLPVCKEKSLKSTLNYLKECGLQIVACTEKGTTNLYDTDFTLPTGIVMGSEGRGIQDALLKLSDMQVKIYMYGKLSSLNVSVATGIVLYEAVRQREFKST
ncbi:MAG: 23S rRNA (guanosine(2251)-2'-O)-methyltransferase RlmB [Bacteroidia bacterium]|nr:23S rRNA (guanosine(2251)-2'-O)-methyltransferase RlmB [Bacteroidia bacterium]MDW8346056.1 23S rRNA (guanosine(2251)-2'-O)-methyltransferase RlmB [Bacteroidia bacterium]